MTLEEFKKFCTSNVVTEISTEKSNRNELLLKCKNGSKIHIKKKNRGSFTKYCNGKVTEECINRGKNSPDPKIRKKATFAKNARGWSKK